MDQLFLSVGGVWVRGGGGGEGGQGLVESLKFVIGAPWLTEGQRHGEQMPAGSCL